MITPYLHKITNNRKQCALAGYFWANENGFMVTIIWLQCTRTSNLVWNISVYVVYLSFIICCVLWRWSFYTKSNFVTSVRSKGNQQCSKGGFLSTSNVFVQTPAIVTLTRDYGYPRPCARMWQAHPHPGRRSSPLLTTDWISLESWGTGL